MNAPYAQDQYDQPVQQNKELAYRMRGKNHLMKPAQVLVK